MKDIVTQILQARGISPNRNLNQTTSRYIPFDQTIEKSFV